MEETNQAAAEGTDSRAGLRRDRSHSTLLGRDSGDACGIGSAGAVPLRDVHPSAHLPAQEIPLLSVVPENKRSVSETRGPDEGSTFRGG